MPIDHWFAFVAAASVMLVIPGPTVLLVISYTLGHGRRPALAVAAGVALGDFAAMTASMVGLGALLAASAASFTALRWIGGAYLVYLGVKLWRAPVAAVEEGAAPRASSGRMLAHAFAVTALNPKGIVFFVAFVPQFLVATRPFAGQAIILVATFVGLAVLNTLGYVVLASAARSRLRKPRVQRAVNRTGGSLLIGAGVFAAGWGGAST